MAAYIMGGMAEKGREGTFGGNGNILCLDCIVDYMGNIFARLIKLYTRSAHFTVLNLMMIDFLKSKINE